MAAIVPREQARVIGDWHVPGGHGDPLTARDNEQRSRAGTGKPGMPAG